MLLSFESDIKSLFRTKDIVSMRNFGGFDLSLYNDVVQHADHILARLKGGSMPCDGAWEPANVRLFEQWQSEGYPK